MGQRPLICDVRQAVVRSSHGGRIVVESNRSCSRCINGTATPRCDLYISTPVYGFHPGPSRDNITAVSPPSTHCTRLVNKIHKIIYKLERYPLERIPSITAEQFRRWNRGVHWKRRKYTLLLIISVREWFKSQRFSNNDINHYAWLNLYNSNQSAAGNLWFWL